MVGGIKIMEYLTNELLLECFMGTRYEENEDKFLIGHLNNRKNKFKDVVSGQIIEGKFFSPLSELKKFKHNGNDMALGYMTGLRADNASFLQRIKARYIDSILNHDKIDLEDIKKIKKIMNQEIISEHNKDVRIINALNKKNKELEQYSISEEERDF